MTDRTYRSLWGFMVIRNEADRYLSAALKSLQQIVDKVFVYDDQSTDLSVDIALGLGCHVAMRPDGSTSFLEHEGRFRQEAWNTFEAAIGPSAGDWILAVDADEFLVSKTATVQDDVCAAIRFADLTRANSVRLPIPEVFGFAEDGTPLVRTDGEWARIRGSRLFRYLPRATYSPKPMGCGAEPSSIIRGAAVSDQRYGLALMHFGYARSDDQRAKYERYTSLLDHGHSNRHVQSIIEDRALKRWDGPIPEGV